MPNRGGRALELVRSTKIMLGKLPSKALEEVKDAIGAHTGAEAVGTAGSRGIRLLQEARAVKPDVVIIGARDGRIPGECTHLLQEIPELKIMVLAQAGHTATMYDLRHRTESMSLESSEHAVVVACAAVGDDRPSQSSAIDCATNSAEHGVQDAGSRHMWPGCNSGRREQH